MYRYQYSSPVAPPMYHGFDEWQQLPYPPAMPGEHTPGQNFHHFPTVSVCPCRHKGEQRAWDLLPSERLFRATESPSRELSTRPVGT